MKKRILFFSNHLRGPGGSAGARSWHQAKRLSEDYVLDVVIPAIDPVSAKPVTREDYRGLDETVTTVRLAAGSENRRESKVARAQYLSLIHI